MKPSRRVVIGVVCLATLAVAAGPATKQSPEERAREVLSQGLLNLDWGVRLRSWDLAATLDDQGLEAAGRKGIDSPDRVERALALELLARIGVARNRDIFMRELDSPFRTSRVRAVRALATLEDPALIPSFEKVLASDADPDIRAFAAEALGHPWAEPARPALRRAVADGQAVVRVAAVRALVATGDLTIGRELLDRAVHLSGDDAIAVINLAALVPDRALFPALMKILDRPDPTVQVAAAAAILRIAEEVK
jgi:HEAT repeat protein